MDSETDAPATDVKQEVNVEAPEFLKKMEPARFMVLVNQETGACRMVQAPMTVQRFVIEASLVGKPSQVMVMVPQNPEGS